ncbi:hypothetical protein [Exiguobacterium mexicanum]|uniref:hypothetical protein n=1 Tax=Exiguobacterium mexicanum TaxID=340146 RepID=UPI0037C0C1C6
MRKILIGVLLGSSLLLASCGAESSNYLSTTSVEEIADIKTEQESAYVLVDSDSQGNEGAYVDTVREVATEKRKTFSYSIRFSLMGKILKNVLPKNILNLKVADCTR